MQLSNFLVESGRTNILMVKKELLRLKKEGLAFFTENLSELREDSEIEIYFHIRPGKTSTFNSFPVPKEQFTSIKVSKANDVTKNKDKNYKLMSTFYEKYYSNSEFNEDIFHSFSKEPFIGKKYVWFSKNKTT